MEFGFYLAMFCCFYYCRYPTHWFTSIYTTDKSECICSEWISSGLLLAGNFYMHCKHLCEWHLWNSLQIHCIHFYGNPEWRIKCSAESWRKSVAVQEIRIIRRREWKMLNADHW